MDIFTPVITITCFYGIISFALYTWTVSIVHKKCTGSFFFYYKVFYVFNLLIFLNSFITVRLPRQTHQNGTLSALFESHSSAESNVLPLYYFFFFQISSPYYQYIITLLISLNRVTLLFFPIVGEFYWRKIRYLSLTLVIFVPLYVNFELLSSNVYWEYNPVSDNYAISSNWNMDLGVYMELFMLMATIIGLFINFISVLRLNYMGLNIKKSERNIFYISLINFIIDFLAYLNIMMLGISIESDQTALWVQIYNVISIFVGDFPAISQPWLLLLFSSNCRCWLAEALRINKNSIVYIGRITTNNPSISFKRNR